MRPSLPALPVTDCLDALSAALETAGLAVLAAPPGAGKTTIVPLHLLDAPWRGDDRIILLEPRRLAARAAARRMASLLGEEVGDTVGYRMRLDNRVSSRTRIEVVTEGVFARMILDDPELAGVAAVLFDEFHERSLDADLGLALALDVRAALRPDLRLLVMSATLDIDGVAGLLGQPPVIVSEGRSFPVDILYRDRQAGERIEDSMAQAIRSAIAEDEGSILAFLPGQGEIERTMERLSGRFGPDIRVLPLFGNLTAAEQDQAIRPAEAGSRKVVLATSIAETSITIDGVRIVIDSGLQRLPVFEPATQITRLETVKVSRASADQRAGRAGRTAPGKAIRLWHPGQTAALPAFTPPQILASDLTQLALDLAHWGVTDPGQLAFLDPPPRAALAEARGLLVALDALDDKNGLTETGRRMRHLALPPRLAAMVMAAAPSGQARRAARLAVLLTEQGLGGSSVDLDDRLQRFERDSGERARSARRLADKMAESVTTLPSTEPVAAGRLLLHAFPDRIARQRGGRGRFVMANGRGAELAETERLAGASMLVVADLTGRAAAPRILAAAELDKAMVDAELASRMVVSDDVFFDAASGQVRARRVRRIGTVIFEESPLPRPSGDLAAKALAEGLARMGLASLPFSRHGDQLRERLGFLHRTLGEPWPDVSDEALLGRLDEWFVPYQSGVTSLASIAPAGLSDGLRALVPHDLVRKLDDLAPTHYLAPTGQRHSIRYDGEEPVLAIRVQELFGLKDHPAIGGGRMKLVLELLSPAQRPIQTTRDLPGFWAGSWKDVRSDMRGRYPKHPWPDNPAEAAPTHRAKPRGT